MSALTIDADDLEEIVRQSAEALLEQWPSPDGPSLEVVALALPEHVTNLCLRCKRAEAEVERLRALVTEVTT